MQLLLPRCGDREEVRLVQDELQVEEGKGDSGEGQQDYYVEHDHQIVLDLQRREIEPFASEKQDGKQEDDQENVHWEEGHRDGSVEGGVAVGAFHRDDVLPLRGLHGLPGLHPADDDHGGEDREQEGCEDEAQRDNEHSSEGMPELGHGSSAKERIDHGKERSEERRRRVLGIRKRETANERESNEKER